MNLNEVAHVKHLVMPGFEVDRLDLLEGESISAFLARSEWDFKLPTICVVNGSPILRKDWDSFIITAEDEIVFYSRPYGGGGGQNKMASVGALVGMIALAAFAPYIAGPAILGFAAGSFGFFAATAAMTVAGGYLINTFLMPKASNNDQPAPAQLFTLNGAGNTANPFQSIPVMYGDLKWEPPYAALPWSDYIGNDQYLNLILCLGMGKVRVNNIWMDDSLLWDRILGAQAIFDGGSAVGSGTIGVGGGSIGTTGSFQICEPGTPFTLFPANVVTSTDVSGQEFIDTTKIGFFSANPPTTQINAFVLDFLLPAGLQATDGNDGSHSALAVHIFAELQQIDDAGTPIGSIIQCLDKNVVSNTNQPTRLSFEVNMADFSLPNGRYQVRVWRNPGPQPDTQHNVDVLVWVQLRGYIVGSQTFDDVTVIGLRIKATSQLSGNGSKHFGIGQTRILPIWNGSAFVDTPTRNAFWAFYDAATNEIYGANWPVNKIDFQTIVDQATAADSRGDGFDFVFNSATTFQEAFDKILQSNRTKTCFLGDVLSCVRDEWKPIPQMLLTDQQIVRGSLEVDYQINNEDNTDSVQLQFLNRNTWHPAQLQYPKDNPPTFVSTNPAKLQIEGITDPDQVWRELQFWYKQASLRRIKVRLDTEHDGRILRFGSAVKVQSHMPRKWGVTGEVVSYNPSTHILTVSTDITSALGQHYIELRDKAGKYFGPVAASVSSSRTILVDTSDLAVVEATIGMTIEDALDRMDGAEPPSFVWGLSSELSRNCIVLSGRPNDNKVQLELSVDVETVHDDSDVAIGIIQGITDLTDPRIPIISLLSANFTQGVIEPTLTASWFPAKGAIYYRAQLSYDSGVTWVVISDHLQDPTCTAIVSFANLRVRVAGVGPVVQGPWSFVDVTAPDINLKVPIKTKNLEAGLHDFVVNQLQQTADEISKVAQQIAAVAAEHDSARTLNVLQTKSQLISISDDISASVTTVSEALATSNTAFASYQTTVNAHLGSIDGSVTTNATAIASANSVIASNQTAVTVHLGTLDSSVTTNATAIAAVDGTVAAMFSLTTEVNGYVTGFESINDGITGAFQVIADKFVVAKPGVSGGSPLNVFQIGTSGGVASIVFSGNMYADGTITTRMLLAASVTAAVIAAGAITASKMAADSITAANGAIDSLAVLSLNIADNAVTVPQVQSYSGNIPTTSTVLLNFTLVIDTTGLAGKTIVIYAISSFLISNTGTATILSWSLFINGAVVQSVGGSYYSANTTLSGSLSIVGNGGVMSIPVQVRGTAGPGTVVSASGTLFAIAAKR